NIPGVAGVGEKTATELLQKYGSLDGIYEHLDDVATRFRTKLESGKETAYLSRRLATIVTDVAVDFNLEACRIGMYDRDRVVELFRTLEFNSLLRRLPKAPGEAEEKAVSPQPQPATGPGAQLSLFGGEVAVATPKIEGPTKTIIVTEAAALEALVQALNSAQFISFDVETTSTDPLRADLVGISLSIQEGEGYYIPVGHKLADGGWQLAAGESSGQPATSDQQPATSDQLPLSAVLSALTPPLTNPRIPKYGHNLKYDYEVLARAGLVVAPLTFDTMLAEWLCDPASNSLGLKKLAFVRLGIEMTEIKELIGTGKKQITMDQVPIALAAPYAAADTDMTARLVPILKEELKAKGQLQLLEELEMPLIPILADMEMTGIALDASYLAEMSKDLEGQLAKIEKQIYEWVGYEFNINSTQQLSEALFGKLQLRSSDKSR